MRTLVLLFQFSLAIALLCGCSDSPEQEIVDSRDLGVADRSATDDGAADQGATPDTPPDRGTTDLSLIHI